MPRLNANSFRDPDFAHNLIFVAARRITWIDDRLTDIVSLPLDQASADIEASDFVERLRAERQQQIKNRTLYLGATALQLKTPRITYRFYDTPHIAFSHILFGERDERTGIPLLGEAVHIFDDPGQPEHITTTIESINCGDEKIIAMPATDYSPWTMRDILGRLETVLIEYGLPPSTDPSQPEQPAPDDTILPFPTPEPGGPDPDQPA